MRLFQECCIAHTEELGMGRAKTLDRGFLWVITSERFLVERWPEYDETIILRCTPGKMLHYFFPRHLKVLDKQGNVLIRAVALWALIDEKNREMIDPKENGVIVEGEERGDEIAPALMIPTPALEASFTLHATYSLVDINGHLNNASYMDALYDHFQEEDLQSGVIREFALCFKKEIRRNESIAISFDKSKNAYYASCPNFAAKIALFSQKG